ncbi:MAG: hypothetical protein KY468_12730 [Armatimonadetes bacterium]|nr:hypothetical protein [Armatimonadota bacterium]
MTIRSFLFFLAPIRSRLVLFLLLAASCPLNGPAFSAETPPTVESASPAPDDFFSRDPRLNKLITVRLKAGDLKELADTLSGLTGARYYVAKELEEIKLTVLAKEVTARSVMEQVARMFHLTWRVHGDKPERYRYQLTQTLRERLAEEERRRKDEDEMLLHMVEKLDALLPYTRTPKEELKLRAEEAKARAEAEKDEAEKRRWQEHAGALESMGLNPGLQDALHLYSQLAPDDMIRLRNGEKFNYTLADRTLSRDAAERLQKEQSRNTPFGQEKLAEVPLDRMRLELGFHLNRDRPDQVIFVLRTTIGEQDKGYMITEHYNSALKGVPDRTRIPLREPDPRLLEAHPILKKKIALAPEPDLPPEAAPKPEKKPGEEPSRFDQETGNPRDFIDSADFFAALHEKTGQPILADYYLRTYEKTKFKWDGVAIWDVLNRAAESLQSEWAVKGDFVTVRRHNYFSERTLDVPNRLLRRWKIARTRPDFPTLDELSEIAVLPEPAFKLWDLELALRRRHGIREEWGLAGNNRDSLLLYASLPPEGRRKIVSAAGLPLAGFTGEQLRLCEKALRMEMPREISPEDAAKSRILLHLRPDKVFEYQDWEKVHPPVYLAPSQFKGDWYRAKQEERDRDQDPALEKAQAWLKSMNASDEEIAGARRKIRGPRIGIVTLLQVGNRYWAYDRPPGGESSGDGEVKP